MLSFHSIEPFNPLLTVKDSLYSGLYTRRLEMRFFTMSATGATMRRLQRFEACSICRSFSVNMSEVDKFSAMSKIWWDPKKNPLIKMNPTR